MKGVIPGLILVGLASTSCEAADAKGAIKEFGLEGSWMIDCSKSIGVMIMGDMSNPQPNERFTFSVPRVGRAVMAVSGLGQSIEGEVIDATIVSENKIKIDVTFKAPRGSNKGAATVTALEAIYVLEKDGKKIRRLSAKLKGSGEVLIEDGREVVRSGPNARLGSSVPWQEKCRQ